MATHNSSKCKELLVAAIDFGTTYSGYAFSFKTQYNELPTKISANSAWTSGTVNLISLKTPTVLLVHWNEGCNRFTRQAFGYNAEAKYQSHVDDDEQENYYLIRNFKMELYNKTASSGLTRDSTVPVCDGKSIQLLQTISWMIEYLKDHLLDTLKTRNSTVGSKEIRWLLTVPAIWTDAGKQMMMEAATMAGIPEDKLTLVLEPEAVSLYCMNMPSHKSENKPSLQEGTRFIVVDAGGGTVDITVHQINDGGGLLELHAPTGGPWGGTMVDCAFTNFLSEYFSKEVFETFSKKCTEDWIELLMSFELKKRNIGTEKQWETLRIPASLSKRFRKHGKEAGHYESFENLKFKDSVKLVNDKLKINHDLVQNLFKDSLDNITLHVEELLIMCDNISTIILAGGYSESQLLQNAFKSKFKDQRIIVPEEAGLAVVKGAVMYGHDPQKIISRVAPFTYGTNVSREFDMNVHNFDKLVIHDGIPRCDDVFCIHITKGDDLKWGTEHPSATYVPIYRDATSLLIKVYISNVAKPMYVTDKTCTYIGEVRINLTDTTVGTDRGIEFSFGFDGHIVVTAVERATRKQVSVSLNFLS